MWDDDPQPGPKARRSPPVPGRGGHDRQSAPETALGTSGDFAPLPGQLLPGLLVEAFLKPVRTRS
jgi:hypothetical protein